MVLCFSIPAAVFAQNWSQQNPATSPTARDGSAMVYDPVRHQTVLFGGLDSTGTALLETWVYNGSTWQNVTPPAGVPRPTARAWPSMAFDTAHSTVVLFGGCSTSACSTLLGDTWLWNGTTWTNANPATAPSARRGSAMTYSGIPFSSGLMLFGGSSATGAQADMWSWDGTNWNPRESSGPTIRAFSSISYDPIHQQLVMFGGSSGLVDLRDTWIWTGSPFWVSPELGSSPPARSSQGQVYDPVRQVTVMFGGSLLNDTWTWDGSGWSQESTATSPAARQYVNLAYDTQHADTVLFGGLTGSGAAADTWTLGYVYTPGWMQYSPFTTAGSPSARAFTAAATDGTSAFIFGGVDSSNNLLAELWSWGGAQYAIYSATGPTARQAAAMVNVPGTGLLLFGGGGGTGGLTPQPDTWIFNGNWVSQSTGPTARYGHTMAYDPINQQAVLFGGFNNGILQDTWTWSGGVWTQAAPATAPPARQFAAMVYDGVRSQTLMFGGQGVTTATRFNDTWVWNGANWQLLSPATKPSARSNAHLVYDSVHGTVLLFGGVDSTGPLGDLWQWDGVNWTLLTPNLPSPSNRLGAAATFIPAAQQFYLFGGDTSSGTVGDTWMYASPYTQTTLPTAFYGQPYNTPITAVGGISPYTYTELGYPNTFENFNISLNSSTGIVNGANDSIIPGQQPIIVGMTIADSQGQKPILPIALVTDTAIAFTPNPPHDATAGATYSYQLSATGGTPPFHFAASTSLTWLSIDSSGVLHANCTANTTPTTGTFSLLAFDSLNGTTQAGPFTINCNPVPQITNASPLPGGELNHFYSVQLTTNAVYDAPGASPFTWSANPSSLPAGLSLDSTTGLITGVPTTTGTTNFNVTFTDARNATVTKPLQITVIRELTLTTTALPIGNVGVAYPLGVKVAATGGVPGYTFSATGLPDGLLFDTASGAITGTPTTAGVSNTVFGVTDSANSNMLLVIPMDVVAPGGATEDWIQLSPVFSPSPRQNAAIFYDSVRANTILFGGVGPSGPTGPLGDTNSWNGSNWTALSPAGAPSARESAMAAFDPVHQQGVLFGGMDGTFARQNDTWLWNGTTWTQANPKNSPSARVNGMMAWDGHHIVLFGGTNSEQDNNETWIWDGTNWSQPTLATSPGSRHSAGMVYDSVNNNVVMFSGLAGFTDLDELWIWDGGAMTWTQIPGANAPGARDSFGMAYDVLRKQSVVFGGAQSSSEGVLNDTWAWNGSVWNAITTFHSPGSRQNPAMVWDSGNSKIVLFGGTNPDGSQFYLNDTWVLGGPFVTNTTLPSALVGTPYSDPSPAIGGIAPLTFSQSGAPSWMSVNSSTGTLSGIPNSAGNSSFTYTVIDSQGVSSSATFSLSTTSSLAFQSNAIPDATAATNYSVQLAATGGLLPYVFSATGLPAGLQISSSGLLSGSCTGSSSNLVLKVNDSATPTPGLATEGPLSITCNPFPALTTASPLTSGVVGTPYTNALQKSGGTPPILWTLGTNTLPQGFQLSSTGVLTGPATAPFSATLNVSVSDFWHASASKTYTLAVYPVLGITTASLPNGTAGVAYPSGVAIVPSGGTGTGTYGYTATGLPAGLSIDPSTGVISGTTNQTGPFTPTFRVTDQDAQIASKQINLTILNGSGLTILSPATLPTGATGQLYSYQLQWSGGVLPVTVASRSLPTWLQLNASTGALTGTPTTGGAFTFPITVTDSQTPTPNTASQTETIVVNPPTITSPSPLPSATIGIGYSQNLTAGAGQSPYTWVSANLPAWLSLSSAGALTGTPPVNTPASVSFDVTVTDSLGAFNKGTLVLPVLATPGLFFLTTSPLPAATPNTPYSTTVEVSGGNGVLSVSASGLPTWLNFNSRTGVLSGTPPSAGPVTFQLTLSDNVNQSLSQFFTLPVNAALTFGTSSLPAASVGLPYQVTLSGSGGTGIYTWSAAGLPSWLSLSPGGVFSGTPPQATPVTLRITLADSQSHTIGQTFTIPVHSALTIDTASPLPPATLNFPYQATFSASGGGGNYQWSATGLPGGFTLSPSGALLGTPSAATTISFTAIVTDSLSNSATLNVTLPVSSSPTVNTTLPQAVVGVPYSANLTASGGTPGYSFGATGLPSWLSITQAGYLSGTPTTAGQVNFQATVTDSQQTGSTAQASIVVNPSLSITTATLPQAVTNAAYSTTLAATGGIGSYTWSSTNLPKGLTISAAGVLSGTLITGSYPLQITVWDSQTSVATQNYTLLVASGTPLSFVTQSLNPCMPIAACSNQIVATGGLPPYTFSVPANVNLNGLSLSATGLLSGTPLSGGNISVPVTLKDQLTSITKTFTQPVADTLTIDTVSLPAGTVGVNYGTALRASGGQPPYTWSMPPGSGPLPAGLSIDAQGGNIYGMPSTAGTYTFSVQVSDAQQTSPAKQLSIVIAPPAVVTPLAISSPSQLAAGLVGTAYSQNLTAFGGSGSYSWAATTNSLPAGLSLSSSGAITGSPSATGTVTFTATVTDSSGKSASAGFTIVVASSTTVALITPNPLPNGAVGVTYIYPIQVLGGTPPYFYSITSGQLPPGLTFDVTNGNLTGTPTQQGSYSVVLHVSDSGTPAGAGSSSLPGSPTAKAAQANVTSNYTIQITATGGFQITTPQTLPNATLNVSYSTTFAASGGAGPYQWQLVTGTLPTGLSFSGAGSITGTPTLAGLTSLVVKATDTTGATATGAFELLVINPNMPFISPFPPLPSGTVGQTYQIGLAGAGGHTAYTWSIVSGSLPPGVSLNTQAGTLNGTPTQTGNFPFTAQITDSKQVTTTQSFTLRVNSLTLQVTPAQIPAGTANTPYSFAPTVTGGTAPYSWSLSAGGLLSGFAIDPATGVITGTPTVTGTVPFTISVTDSNFGIASQTYQFTVQGVRLSIQTASVPAATLGTNYNVTLQAANSTPPLAWSIASGTLPPGIQLNPTSGLLSGTPTTAGSYTFTVQVQDSTSATAQATFTIVASVAPLSIVTTTLPGGAVAAAYTQTVRASGGTGAIAWSVLSGTLPTGLSLGSTSGAITGTPTAPASFTFILQATDSKGVTAQQSFTVVIAGPPAVPAITITGLPATSKPGDQPTLTITLASAYPLPITVTATLSISPNPGNSTDLMFANGSRTTQITIPANVTTVTLPFQTGTLAGTITVSLALSAAGVDVTPSVPPAATTAIASAVPTISSVAIATTTTSLQVTVIGTSTTRDMKTAAFHFTAASGATLQTTDLSIDVSSMFTTWYQSAASLATGSQFSLNMQFNITSGKVSDIASVTVTLTNSAGASTPATANVP